MLKLPLPGILLQMGGLPAILLWSIIASSRGDPTSGVLHSPNHPGYYRANTNHTDRITVADNQRILITFTTLDIDPSDNCTRDHVLVMDGDGSELLGRTCGTSLPPIPPASPMSPWSPSTPTPQ